MKANCGQDLHWKGCYKGTFDLWSPDAYSHPAKMSIPLAFRIMEHLKDLRLLKDGDVILDPMCGISTTGIVAGALGFPYIGVELEPKFIELSQKNQEYAERRLHKKLNWQILQGDSRRLSELLGKDGLKSVMSPPYQDSKGHPSLGSVNKDNWGGEGKDIVGRRGLDGEYGTTEGQIANLKDAPLKAITSPPYCEAQSGGGIAIGYHGQKPIRTYMPETHGQSEGQIGNLRDAPLKSIVSPPYTESTHHTDDASELEKYRPNRTSRVAGTAGKSDGNIGQLSDKPLKSVMSPPYELMTTKDNWEAKVSSGFQSEKAKKILKGSIQSYNINNPNNIGNTQAESYLEAMLQVYQEIARCSSVLVCVLKDPTRNGKIRTLGYDTWKLLEQTGWKVVDYHRALLFQETQEEDLFGNIQKKPKGRISFFKRLSYQKGNPVSNYEHIIIAVRVGSVDSMTGIGAKDALTAECALPTGLQDV